MTDIMQTHSRKPVAVDLGFWQAGWGALLSGVILLIGVIHPDRELSKLLIISVTPLALIPVIPALDRVIRPLNPMGSIVAVGIGLAGILPLLIAVLIQVFHIILSANELNLSLIDNISVPFAGLTGLIGLWIALASYLGLRTNAYPIGISLSGIVTGLTRVTIVGSLMLSSIKVLPSIMLGPVWDVGLLFWITTHLVWSFWLGIWFLGKRKIENPC